MFSHAETVGSWVRIPLEAWFFIRVSSLFVLSCVGSGLATGLTRVPGILLTVYKTHNSRKMLMGTDQKAQNERKKKFYKRLAAEFK
jgi:hypothetical protein